MLMIGRRPGEALILDGQIRVVIKCIDQGTVRLGIEAPRDVKIVREELLLHDRPAIRERGRTPTSA